MGLRTIADFELIEKKNDCSLLIDYENKIVKVSWSGKVGAETASFLLAKALQVIVSGEASTILLDRKNLDEFSKGARLWIKEDFLKERVRHQSNRIKKIATIKSVTPMGGIYSNLISAAIKIVLPFLAMAEFQSEEEAFGWLTND